MRTNLCEKTNLVPSIFIVTFDFVSSFGKTGTQYPQVGVLQRITI